jgi:S-adenosylmethionine synthetase
MKMSSRILTAEYVFPGHPDKLCDAIADSLVEEAARREKRALVGVEVAVHRGSVFVTGRIACHGAEEIDVTAIARDVYASAGYCEQWPPSPSKLAIRTDLCLGPLLDGEAEFRAVADDQSIVTGYAVNLPATNYLPPEHWLAWRLSARLQKLRHEQPDLRLGPDGKVIVGLEERDGGFRLAWFSASLQQAIEGDQIALHRAVHQNLESELGHAAGVLATLDAAVPEQVSVNGAGNFAVGGPEGDNGLTGKKLVVDAYGPRVPIGGGALCGKDFYKADRAGAIIARRIAKGVVMTGAARECTATLAFVPGAKTARIESLVTGDGSRLDAGVWSELIDRSLEGIGDRYAQFTPLAEVSRCGHFTAAELPWERLSFDTTPMVDEEPQGVHTKVKVADVALSTELALT